MRRLVGLSLALAWPVSRAAAGSEDPEPRPAELSPCSGDSAAYEEAARALRDLSGRIEKLAGVRELAAIQNELDRILAGPCFALSAENPRPHHTSSPLAFRTWWKAGGRDWMESYLDLARSKRWVILPPDVPRSIALEDAPDHRLAPLLCRSDDPKCREETGGWRLRFEALIGRARVNPMEGLDRDARSARCAADPEGRTYDGWRSCLEKDRGRMPMLPLGELRAPRAGWLVLRGRRGHYTFCDEVRAYDLGSGGAFVAESCSGLALRKGGTVDQDRTDAVRKPALHTGRIPIEALREAAWALFLADEITEAQPYSESYVLPAGMAPRWPKGRMITSFDELWANDGQTLIAWTWQDGGRILLKGELTWPRSSTPGEDYAAVLLAVAEAEFVEGPSPANLPASLRWETEPGKTSRIDADPERLEAVDRKLIDVLQQAAEKARGKAGQK